MATSCERSTGSCVRAACFTSVAPIALHPRHQAEVLDVEETGGHVRAGYTFDEFRDLLQPVGFVIEREVGIGPRSLYQADEALRTIRSGLGDAVALPLFPLTLPFVWLARMNPPVPFSLYVTAVKPLDGDPRVSRT